MRIQTVLNLIPDGAKSSPLLKVIFQERDTRFPMIGKIVFIKDADMLAKKGMVRFVNQSRLDSWSDENPQMALTRIYVTSDFSQIRKMSEKDRIIS